VVEPPVLTDDPSPVTLVGSSTAGRFTVQHWRGPASGLHRLSWPEPLGPTIWWLEVARPALVLGSVQARRPLHRVGLAAAGVDVVTRRSGGAAVALEPGNGVWIDVLVPRRDPVWLDDVGHSFVWLGEAWVAGLAALGLRAAVHRGPPDHRPDRAGGGRAGLADEVCFAGLGWGEVTIGGAKAVGLSQRRTRAGARFQTLCYRWWDPGALSPLGIDPAVLPEVAVVDREPAAVATAMIEAVVERAG